MTVQDRESMDVGGEHAAGDRIRNRLALAAAVCLVVFLLIILPPLLNVSRYQRRIATTMSESLGRPVHLDNVTLHLLPIPGFTLENLVVSEDPAFGNEPTIRANEVVATLRVSSLWHRRVEFSTVRFVQPSVNLVRNADGHWNLEAVLVHASRVDTAPTVQPKAGAAPRFPYIEATGGRINIKLGEEKMPFSLTDADFALWLPSPQTWRVRMEGKPMRTDANIGDPGTVRMEGSLERAAHMEDVPVDLHASWYDAPLGEASRLISGDDRGWRGTLHAEASLRGPLSAATLVTKVTLDGLRRADFVPVQPLDVTAQCTAAADVPATRLTKLHCALPVGGSTPIDLTVTQVDLTHPDSADAAVQAENLPLDWVFGWLRLLSPRIPSDPHVPGSLDVALTHEPETPLRSWSGTATATMPLPGKLVAATSRRNAVNAEPTQSFTATVSPANGAWSAQLPPSPLRLGAGAELTVSGQASPSGYSFTLNGEASSAQLTPIVHAFPQLGDDVQLSNTKGATANPDAELAFAISCTRLLSGGQVCTSPAPVAPRPARRAGHARHR